MWYVLINISANTHLFFRQKWGQMCNFEKGQMCISQYLLLFLWINFYQYMMRQNKPVTWEYSFHLLFCLFLNAIPLILSYKVFPKTAIWLFFGEDLKKIFLQNDSLGVFLCEKSIARIEKSWKCRPDHEISNFRIFKY